MLLIENTGALPRSLLEMYTLKIRFLDLYNSSVLKFLLLTSCVAKNWMQHRNFSWGMDLVQKVWTWTLLKK